MHPTGRWRRQRYSDCEHAQYLREFIHYYRCS
ncbi:hypothetical protein PSPO01_04740 [Paraphaeosphaeria sporulosa]